MAKKIMIQGTMSGAGKSLLCAGLCRIFRQDGYRVAPFKSQNMALNSFITADGREMGRAQVVQAEAAGVEPSADMNPILLKPASDTGSQVIVNGQVLGTMSAREYFAYKKQLVPQIQAALARLDEAYDILVLEGAGSPAEINLREGDIVNMGMARMARSPVLLAGDIDRGGVFAQLLGTLQLLEPEEREMVKGLIINKFRGDKTILDPGVAELTRRAKVPVLGVVPFLDVEIEEEDSLARRLERQEGDGLLDIAVIRLPRISNFTDFLTLENRPEIALRYVKSPARLGQPDLILLPGSKNTMEDLAWLRESGLEAQILKAAARGAVVFGICGGYQMLGETLEDPLGVEAGGSMRGLGLLPLKTTFTGRKTRTRVQGVFGPCGGALKGLSGGELEGYEIHMGKTRVDPEGLESGQEKALTRVRDQISGQEKADGAWEGNVYGTYVHGIFDREEVTEALIRCLAEKKGISPEILQAAGEGREGRSFREFKEQQYDRLAAGIRESLPMEQIYKILEQGI